MLEPDDILTRYRIMSDAARADEFDLLVGSGKANNPYIQRGPVLCTVVWRAVFCESYGYSLGIGIHTRLHMNGRFRKLLRERIKPYSGELLMLENHEMVFGASVRIPADVRTHMMKTTPGKRVYFTLYVPASDFSWESYDRATSSLTFLQAVNVSDHVDSVVSKNGTILPKKLLLPTIFLLRLLCSITDEDIKASRRGNYFRWCLRFPFMCRKCRKDKMHGQVADTPKTADQDDDAAVPPA